MKKFILAALLCAASFAAQAQTVSMTVTATTADYNSYAQMCGSVQGLVDSQVPPQARVCTALEVKAYINKRIMQPYIDWKGAQLNSAALQAVAAPTLSFATN